MKYLLTTILALSATVLTTQVSATGMTYDPYQNYYSKYYGIGVEEATTPVKAATKERADSAFYDPYADYYNANYGVDGLIEKNKSTESKVSEYPDMADPSNYYNW